MNLKVTSNLLFPVASLNLFEVATLLFLIPLIVRVIFPILFRLGVEFTPLRRIGVGMLFACSSVALAGIIEIERKHILTTDGAINQTVFNTTINASRMSVFWQIPQYILQGTGEVLVSVTGTLIHFDFCLAVKYVCWLLISCLREIKSPICNMRTFRFLLDVKYFRSQVCPELATLHCSERSQVTQACFYAIRKQNLPRLLKLTRTLSTPEENPVNDWTRILSRPPRILIAMGRKKVYELQQSLLSQVQSSRVILLLIFQKQYELTMLKDCGA